MTINKYDRPNWYDILKSVAILLMVVDHLGYFFFPDMIILREIWRWSFPLFLMLIGYNQSSKIWNQLWIWTIIISIFLVVGNLMWYVNSWQLNILVGILVTKYIMRYISKWSDIPLVLVFVASIIAIPYTKNIVEYGTCIVAISVFVLLIKRWIDYIKSAYHSDNNENKNIYKYNLIWKYISVLLSSILMIYWLVTVNMHFNFDEIWWFVVLVWWIVSVIFIYILCIDNFGINRLKNTIIGDIIIYINNYAVYFYIIHLIIFYIVAIWVYTR